MPTFGLWLFVHFTHSNWNIHWFEFCTTHNSKMIFCSKLSLLVLKSTHNYWTVDKNELCTLNLRSNLGKSDDLLEIFCDVDVQATPKIPWLHYPCVLVTSDTQGDKTDNEYCNFPNQAVFMSYCYGLLCSIEALNLFSGQCELASGQRWPFHAENVVWAVFHNNISVVSSPDHTLSQGKGSGDNWAFS